ncbi:MAG: hypothetical protein ABEI07_02780 [Candidatus Nanohaloarchaea archaeon]
MTSFTDSTIARTGFLSLVLPSLASLSSAASYYSDPATRFMNQYFLPRTAEVSGISGLLFGVLIPFGIVLILLYYALDNVIGGREAKALAVLISLFIIPSGGYRIISNLFLVVFGLGNTSRVAGPGTISIPGLGPVSGLNWPLIYGFLAFVALAFMFQEVGESEYQGWEHLASIGGGFLVWAALGGAASIYSITKTSSVEISE